MLWTTRDKAPELHATHEDALFYDVSTNAPMASDYAWVIPAEELSPFIIYGGIPVPGMHKTSDTVEGVWQGLKIIKGTIDESYFNGKGRKRKGQPTGHLFHGKRISYVKARETIYVPAYTFMLEHRVDRELLLQILQRHEEGKKQYFFDVDHNPDIHNTKSPLSHAAVLVDYLNTIAQSTQVAV